MDNYPWEKRVGVILEDLKKHSVHDAVPIGPYKLLKSERLGFETTPFEELDWPLMETEIWKGARAHFWFVANAEIPEAFAGKKILFELTTGREGDWDAVNPQFEAYVDGRLVQGLDVNHRTFPLCEQARAGERHRIALRAYSGEQETYLLLRTRLAVLDEPVRKLYYDLAVPYEVAALLEADDKDRLDILCALNAAVDLLDLRKPYSAAFYASVAEAQRSITREFYEKRCGRSEAEVWCVGHTHIDVAWLWTLAVTREKAFRSFSTALELMREYPEYIFMSSQPQLYRFVRERSPELFGEIKARAAEGRWECEGGMWLEADCNLASGEALVRQILYGKRFFRDEFGADSKILWLPDVFGYSAALPQILQKCGMPYFMTTKLSWNEYDKMPYDTFEWEGIDGSKVLTHFVSAADYKGKAGDHEAHFTTYNGTVSPTQVKGTWHRYQQKALNSKVLMSFGFGDGGGGPTPEMLEAQRRLAKGIPGCPKTVMKTAGEYFRTLEAEVKGNPHLPKWVGELYLEFHRGTYTSMARNKKYNRRSEFLLHNVELFASLGKLLTGETYPKKELDALWTVLLRNQFHDILPGSAIKEVYEDSRREYEELAVEGNALLRASMEALASRVGCEAAGIVAFNPCAADGGLVEFDLPEGIANPAVVEEGPDGKRSLPCQKIADGKCVFYAGTLPAMGYAAYAVREAAEPAPVELKASAKGLSNRFFELRLNEKGQFSSIYDKRAGREVLAPGRCGNVLTVYEDKPAAFDNWNIDACYREKSWEADDVQSIEVTECGPVRATVKITRRLLDSTIEQSIRIYRDVPRIDVRSHIDWRENQLLLRAAFPVDVHADEGTFEIQYGNVRRPTHFNTSWDVARFEVCAHKWMDLSEDGYGVSLLNDCKYGCDIHDGVLGLTLLKSGIYPNPDADRETHDFVYSLYPHSGGWRGAGTVQEAYRLNNPPAVCGLRPGSGNLPRRLSFVRCGAANVVTEALKKAEDGGDLIVRVYECHNRRVQTALEFPFPIEKAAECDLMENETGAAGFERNRLSFEIRPYEIKTFKIRPAGTAR